MKKCVNCNRVFDDNQNFCNECGAVLEAVAENNENAESDENSEKSNENNDNTESEENSNESEDDSKYENAVENENDTACSADDSLKESNNQTDINTAENNKSNTKKIKKYVVTGCLVCSVVLNVALVSKNNGYKDTITDYSSQVIILSEQNKALKSANENLQSQYDTLNAENNELKNGASKQLVDIKNAYESGNWQNVVDLAAKLHQSYNGTEEDKQAQTMAQTAQNKIAEQKAAEEAKAKQGYDTGITYDQLARNPDSYVGSKVKFRGKVIQTLEGSGVVNVRIAVNSDYDNIIFGVYDADMVQTRILEDDVVTVYGTSTGLYSYTSTMNATITIPGMDIDRIERS